MKPRMLIGTLLSVIALTLVIGPDRALGLRNAESGFYVGTAPFTTYELATDPTDIIGTFPSIAIDPISGRTFVSFIDGSTRELLLAVSVGTGGNCGWNGHAYAWNCQSLATGDVGGWSSLAIFPGQGALHPWQLGAAYYDEVDYGLKFIAATCTTSCTVQSTVVVDRGTSSNIVGHYTSLKYDSNGVPHIAYVRVPSVGNMVLQYAHKLDGGSGCYMNTNWDCDVIDGSKTNIGRPSLDLNGTNEPRIAYPGGTPTLALIYARYVSNGGNCGPAGVTWQCDPVDSAIGSNAATFPSLYVPKSGAENPRVAYDSPSASALRYAVYVGSGGNCTNAAWNCFTLDDIGNVGSETPGVGLAVDSAGYSIIAYHAPIIGTGGALKWAQPAIRLGLMAGNCGPTGGPPFYFHSWQCELVGGASAAVMGKDPHIAVNNAGLVSIAWSRQGFFPWAGEISFQQLNAYLPMIAK